MTTDSYNVYRVIGMAQRIGIRAPILLLGGILMTLLLDPVLAFILVAMLPFMAILVIYISKKRHTAVQPPPADGGQAGARWCAKTPPASASSARCPRRKDEKKRFEDVNDTRWRKVRG